MNLGRLVALFALGMTVMAELAAQPAPRAQPAAAVPAGPPARRSQWNGYERIDFHWAGRPCVLVLPKEAAPGKPWIWRTDVFEQQPQVDLGLLARGWHVAFMDARDLYGAPRAMALFNELYAHLVIHAGLSRRVVMEGLGQGALYAFNFAATHPTRVAGLYLETPVLDLKSWPGRNRGSREWTQMLEAYGVTEETFAAVKTNPVDRVAQVAAAKIPVLIVTGDQDELAPRVENAGVLETRYREVKAPIEVIVKPGAGSQPQSAAEAGRIVEWLVANVKI